MAYGKYKDLTKRAQSDKVFRDKAFEIASNLKYDGYQREAISKNVYFDVYTIFLIIALIRTTELLK